MPATVRGAVLLAAYLSAETWMLAAGAIRVPENKFRDFEAGWRNRQVYLLIPREQGTPRGLRARRRLLFHYGQPDTYARGASQLEGEYFFDRFRIANIKWKRDRMEILLHRPPYPEEYALVSVRGVSVAVEIRFAGGDFDLMQTNDLLVSFLILEDAFPPRLRLGGEGPPKVGQPTPAPSEVQLLSQIAPGMPSNALGELLGNPLETQHMPLGASNYEYQWFGDYHLIVVLRDQKVLSAHWLAF